MGKGEDLENIYHLYFNDLYRYVYSLGKQKHLTEDIVQETFYRAHIYLDSYSGEKIKPWLFKVAYHTFIDWMRKEKRMSYYDTNKLESHMEKEVQNKSAEYEFLVKQEIDDWFEALETLKVTKRNAVLLRDYFHFSYDEIADVMGISQTKTKVTIYRGRQELKKLRLKRDGEELGKRDGL
ncbi:MULTISPECIES: RNA polymerase sigma factor [Bacillaceae]|uniref:RNA polymerase sigma factor n=1 Tax=Evansella alkalicola TaxID=745819 RepID=A0ABS6JTM0_9BACI|nr:MULTISPECIES: RNA polymerase sigma factor [Bacillaceae]MBU9721931.1 RNA polymerase sigma factor [Bacillus alkalicola]